MGEYAAHLGELDGTGMRIAVVVARYNLDVTERILEGAQATLEKHNVERINVVWAPGAFELPLVAKWLATSGDVDAVICLGAVIRGATAHFEYVAGECAHGIARVALDTGVPVVFGVLTTDNRDQAFARVGGSEGHKGAEAAATAIEMVSLLRALR